MLEGNGHHMTCEYQEHQIESLVDATQRNGDQVTLLCKTMETVSQQYREITRWLLSVVCVIALGQKALDMVQSVWGKAQISVVEAEQK